jgi:Double zinc ribbon
MICPNCENELRQEAAYCGACGAERPARSVETEKRSSDFCSNCASDIAPHAKFCGRCGTARSDQPAQPLLATTLSPVEPKPPFSDGSLDLGFSFPVKIWQALDVASTNAYEVYESALSSQWAGREKVKQFGFISIKDGLLTFDPRDQSGIGRASRGFVKALHSHQEHMFKAHEYSPLTARYFYRNSLLQSAVTSQTYWVIQLTYVRSIQFHRLHKDITTYPPAPISNLLLAVLPGRVNGSYVCSLESQQFVSHPNGGCSPPLLQALNAHVVPVLQRMWAMDYDVLGGNVYRRTDRPGPMSVRPRWLTVQDGEQHLEPLFSPTLFQTDVLNPALWYGQATRLRPSQRRPREFAMGIMPCADSTLLVLQYPTSNVFDRRGALSESHLLPDLAAWVMDAVGGFLQSDRNLERALNKSATEDLSAYVAARRGTRRSATKNNYMGPKDNWIAELQGQLITQQISNHPVLPLEVVLHAATRLRRRADTE